MDGKQRFSITQRARSFGYAGAGIWQLVRIEHNAWIHAFATALVLITGLLLDVGRQDWLFLFIAIALVWITEALNTAIEYLANAVTSEIDQNIKHAKDIAAGAVLIAAGFAIVIAVLVFMPYISPAWFNS